MSVSSSTSPVRQSGGQWFLWTAIAGTFASVWHFACSFFGPLFLGPFPSTDQGMSFTTWFFITRLLWDSLAALIFGLTLGVSLAVAWEPLMQPIVRWSHRWLHGMVRGALIGSIPMWITPSLAGWYIGTSLLFDGFAGLLGGMVFGAMQAQVLWPSHPSQRIWTIWHGFCMAVAFLLINAVSRTIESLLASFGTWFVIWGYMAACCTRVSPTFPRSGPQA